MNAPAKPKKEVMLVQVKIGSNGTLHPLTSYDEERLARFARGTVIEIKEPAGPKSDPMVRKFHMVMHAGARAIGCQDEALKTWVKTNIGYVEKILVEDDRVYWIPRSIADMEGPEFLEFYNRAEEFVGSEHGPFPGETFNSILEKSGMDLRMIARDWR